VYLRPLCPSSRASHQEISRQKVCSVNREAKLLLPAGRVYLGIDQLAEISAQVIRIVV